VRRGAAAGPAAVQHRLRHAHAFPAPSPAPRIIVAGETPAGARLAARHGDAWTCFAGRYDRLRPVFEAELEAGGRSRSAIAVLGAIGVLLFGRKLPDVGRYLGKGIVEFKKGIKGLEDDIEGGTAVRQDQVLESPRPPQRVTATAPKFEDNPGSMPSPPSA